MTRPLLVAAALTLCGFSAVSLAQTPQYRLTPIVGDDPTAATLPRALNERGEATGIAISYVIPDDEFAPIEEEWNGFLWRGGQLIDLGHLGVRDTAPTAINERGVIVGDGVSMIDGAYTYRGFHWQRGDMTAFGLDHAEDINDLGQIIGYDCGVEESEYKCKGKLWRNGRARTINGLPAGDGATSDTYTDPFAINNWGQVVGWSYLGNGIYRAFIWFAGMTTELGVLPGTTDSAALDVNNFGTVIGTSASGALIGERGFVWRFGRMSELHPIHAAQDWTVPRAINDFGLIVGYTGVWASGEQSATVWLREVAHDLNELVHPSDPLYGRVALIDALDINNRGQILVQGVDSTGLARGFVMTPVRRR